MSDLAPINPFTALQAWYRSNCDGDWEHEYAISITNIDNPGWAVSIPLAETSLQDRPFTNVRWRRSDDDWAICRVEDEVFLGNGGSENLVDIIQVFVEWMQQWT